MGCGCYSEKSENSSIKNHKISKRYLDSSLTKRNLSNRKKIGKKFEEISSVSSFPLDNSNNKIKKISKIKTYSNQKYINNDTNLISKEPIICNISLINFNNEKKKKFQIKISKSGTIQDLINLIQIEINNLYKIKDHAILFYKGIKVAEDETINNLLQKENEIIDLNFINTNNIQNKQNEINILDLEVILVPYEEEEDIIKEQMANNSLDVKKDLNEIEKLKEYKFTKKIISCLFPKCANHKDEKLMYICLTCNNSFCSLDFEEHKQQFQEHEIIDKYKLIDLSFEVRNIKKLMNNKYYELLKDMNIDKNSQKNNSEKAPINYISTNDLFNKIKVEINALDEKMESIYNSIRESYQKVNLKFLTIYEDKMPQIVEFSEYVDKTLDSIKNLNTFSNENMFIENYDSYLNIKKISDKYFNNINYLKEIINKYKEYLESFKDKGSNLINYVKQGIDNIYNFSKIKNFEGMFISNNTDYYQTLLNEYNLGKSNYNDISLNTTRDLNKSINLKFLFSDKKSKKFDLLKRKSTNNILAKEKTGNLFGKGKSININLDKKLLKLNSEQIILNKYQNPNQIIPSSNSSLYLDSNLQNKCSSNMSTLRDSQTKNNIYSLIYGTSNLIKFRSKLKKFEIISPDINGIKITKFETYISNLNFKNKFYISGGYSTPKIFFEYDINKNKFIELPEMLSNHYYHNMIGDKNFIYSISGFKSKNVEKYNLTENKWIPLPDLEYERTFPNSLIYNDNLFIFGKINNLKEDSIDNFNIIEYINISYENEGSNLNNKWNQVKIKFNFPFNSGVIKSDTSIILVGGKIDLNESCINSTYIMKIEEINKKFEINFELNGDKIDKSDEFGGNNFYALDEKRDNFGIFSLVNPYSFYIFDKNANKFTNLVYSKQE